MKNKPAVVLSFICFFFSVALVVQTLRLGVVSSHQATDANSELSGNVRKACSALSASLDSLVSFQIRRDVSIAQTQFVGMKALITLCTDGEVDLGLEDIDGYDAETLEKRVRFVQSKMKR